VLFSLFSIIQCPDTNCAVLLDRFTLFRLCKDTNVHERYRQQEAQRYVMVRKFLLKFHKFPKKLFTFLVEHKNQAMPRRWLYPLFSDSILEWFCTCGLYLWQHLLLWLWLQLAWTY